MTPDPIRHAEIIMECAVKAPGLIEASLRQNIEYKPEEQKLYWQAVLTHFLALSDKANKVPNEDTGYDEA